MNLQVIAERDSSLVIFESGKIKSLPNNTYNKVKYRDFKGERIMYEFDDDCYVHETYDNGIFNAFVKNETMQIRDSNTICESIIDHKNNGNSDKFTELFKSLYFKQHKAELMQEMINVFGNRVVTKEVKTKDKGTDVNYIVDDRFMVDGHGVSYYKNNKGWKFLCTVAQGHLSNITISTKIGTIELKSKELEIMGKIGFLLSPDINDNVFLHQLPENLQNVLKAEVEFDMERLV